MKKNENIYIVFVNEKNATYESIDNIILKVINIMHIELKNK